MNSLRKPKHAKLSLSMAIDKHYAQQVQRGEIEQISSNHIEITAKPFATYILFLGLAEHWGRILRKLTGKTVLISGSYYAYDTQELRHETKEYLSKADFLKSL
jgi:hypothetical protein